MTIMGRNKAERATKQALVEYLPCPMVKEDVMSSPTLTRGGGRQEHAPRAYTESSSMSPRTAQPDRGSGAATTFGQKPCVWQHHNITMQCSKTCNSKVWGLRCKPPFPSNKNNCMPIDKFKEIWEACLSSPHFVFPASPVRQSTSAEEASSVAAAKTLVVISLSRST